MSSADIDRLLDEKGNPCLSIVVPTIKYTRARIQNPEVIEKAIEKARTLLSASAWPKHQMVKVLARLNTLPGKLDYMRMQDGLAVFISPSVFKVYQLPIPVTEKVMLGNTFEIRDMVYFRQFLQPYYLLAVSKKRARLFKGTGRDLQEIVNDDFPRNYTEEYEYERPSIGSSSSLSLKSFERDKSILADTRKKTFFRQTDAALKKYVKDNVRLFIAGVGEETADFEHLSHYSKLIAGKINGNYDVDAVHPLAEAAWNKIKEDIRITNSQWPAKLEEALGGQMAVYGIGDVWRSAQEGKGRVLLLEKDYQKRGYLKTGRTDRLLLSSPPDDHDIVQDAADDIIEIVAEKGGDVVILENGSLEKFGHIGLMLRYPG